MRKIGLDVGTARIGVAQSDLLNIIASSVCVIDRTKSAAVDAKKVAQLIKEREADMIVIGLPLKMDGTAGQSVDMIKLFAKELSKWTSAEIVYQDERLSTVSAQRMLLEADVRRDKRKGLVDKIAASIILQNYLDKIKK